MYLTNFYLLLYLLPPSFVLLTHTYPVVRKSKTGNISNSVFSSANLSLTIKIDTRPFRKPGEAPTLAMIHGRVRARHCVNIGPTIKTVPQPTRCDAKGRLRKFRLFAALG